MKKKLTQKRLRELLDYNPETGIFTWRVKKAPRLKIGEEAGWIGDRYRQIGIDRNLYSASRLAWLYMEGFLPEGIEVDHIDRVKSNNKWENLRLISHACNAKNIGLKSHNVTGVNGVCFDKARNAWLVQMQHNGERVVRKRFKTKIDAIICRWESEKEYNWQDCNTTSSAYLYLKERGLV